MPKKKAVKKTTKKKKSYLEEYCDFVTSLGSEFTMKDFNSKLGTGGLGLAGEAGEVADIAKKVLFHGMEFTDEVKANIKKELGDVMWYVAFTARNVLEITLEEVIDANVAKLKDRYKGGKFSTKEFMDKERKKK